LWNLSAWRAGKGGAWHMASVLRGVLRMPQAQLHRRRACSRAPQHAMAARDPPAGCGHHSDACT
jgi:hypothetical protein